MVGVVTSEEEDVRRHVREESVMEGLKSMCLRLVRLIIKSTCKDVMSA
jgi:hypothetical protein